MYPGYNMIINTILVFYAIKKLDADSSKQVRHYVILWLQHKVTQPLGQPQNTNL